MLLPYFAIFEAGRFDRESALLADRHYSRQTPGSEQFCPPGELLHLRDAYGTMVLAFVHQLFRMDAQRGVYCSIFRNESPRLSSEILLEAESFVRERWGSPRLFTLITPSKVASPNPGYCFKCAGWRFESVNSKGQHVLAKHL